MSIPKTQLGWLDTALLLPYAVMQVRERWWEREREKSEEGEKERKRDDIIAVFSIRILCERETPKKLEFAVSLTFNMLLW